MTLRPEALLLGPNRARILGLSQDSSKTRDIEHWLATRSEVIQVEHVETSGSMIVHFTGGARPGRFVRALRERLHLLTDPAPTESLGVKPVHSLDGRTRFQIKGVSGHQLAVVASMTAARPGVKRSTHLLGSDTVLVEYDSASINEDHLVDLLRKIAEHDSGDKPPVSEQLRWGGALAGTSVLIMCLSRAFPMPVMAIGITLVALRPVRRSAEALIEEGKLNIDSLDVAATFAALITGRPATAAFVIWMVGIGDLLLDISAKSARHALAKLIHQKEQDAWRILQDGTVEKVSCEALQAGDRIIIQSGQAIVADGKIVEGHAEVDEKALTGESRLMRKKKDDQVLASTFVVQGRIVVEVEVAARDTEAAKIERVLSSVGNKPLTLQREALEFGGKLVPPTFAVAGLAATFASSVTPGVCVLVTDFGTGIRIAVPTSALTAMTLAARQGILVKGAQYLERLSKTDVIIFDKTGTLTSGLPEVVEVVTSVGYDENLLIQLAASAEIGQEHPVARALRSHAERIHVALKEPEPGSEEYSVGLGLTARVNGHRIRVGRAGWFEDHGLELNHLKKDLVRLKGEQVSTLCVAIDDKVAGIIGYSDGTRPESAAIVRELQADGRRKVVLLSGDNDEVVRKVAREVGIDEAFGSLLPGQKADYVRKLKAEGHVVAMIGDGINDAPALALADVGISIAGSAEVALETADVILLEGGLQRLPKAFAISDGTMESVKRSLGLIIAPNAAAILLGAFGYIGPAMAAIINNGATFVAVGVSTFPLLWMKRPVHHSEAITTGHPSQAQERAQKSVRKRRLSLIPRIPGSPSRIRKRLLQALRRIETTEDEEMIDVAT